VAACAAGAAHAALQLLQSPASVRQRATELLRELASGIASAPDASVFDAFAKASAMWGRVALEVVLASSQMSE
jgi:hypothetical protein